MSDGRPLRVGIQLPEVEREVRWPEYVAMARAAEVVRRVVEEPDVMVMHLR